MGLEPSVAVCGAFGRGPHLGTLKGGSPAALENTRWRPASLGFSWRPTEPSKPLGCGAQSTREHPAALMGLQGSRGQVQSMEWGCTEPSGLGSVAKPKGEAWRMCRALGIHQDSSG